MSGVRCRQILTSILNNLVSIIDEVIIAFKLDKLICEHLHTIRVEIIAINAAIELGISSINTKIVHQSSLCIRFCYTLNACQQITMNIETISNTIYDEPCVIPGRTTLIIARSIPITHTALGLYPNATRQASVIKVEDNCLIIVPHTVNGLICLLIEEIPVVANLSPAAYKHTELCITIRICILIEEETGISCLTNIDTILAKVVVETVDLIDAGELLTVNVVSEAAVLYSPAILFNICKGVAILEGSVGCAKPCTGLAVVLRIGIYEGMKTEDLLVFGLLSKGIKRICSEVSLVADATCINNAESAVAAPVSAILGSKLDTGEHAKGICSCGINSRSLVNPVKLKCKSIGRLVKVLRCKAEVLVTDLKLAMVNNEVVVKVNNCSDLCKHAYTLCKLKKEVPSCCALNIICAGKHVDKVVELAGNRNLCHIKSEDIVSCHICAKINSCISDEVYGCSILNITKPCELTVTTCCKIKVKGVLALSEHVKSDCATDRFIICKANLDVNNLNTGSLVTNEYISVDSAVAFLFKNELNILVSESNGLVIVACCYGKNSVRTVNCIHMCSGEVNVLGNNNVHLGCTDDFTIMHHINFNSTVSETGEYTVCRNSCPLIVANCPSVTLGKLNLVTGRADTGCLKLYGSADSGVLVLALDYRVIELGRAGCGRNHKKRGRYRTCKTIRRSVEYAKLIRTGLSCNECSRSTTVKVDRLNATCLEHDLCDLLHATTAGEGLLTTVKYHEYYLTGLGDTNRSSGSTARIIVIVSANSDFAILNKKSTETTNSLLKLILVDVVVIILSTNNSLAVLGNTEESGSVDTVILGAIHDKETAGLTGRHVKAVSVNAYDYVIVFNIVGAVRIATICLSGIRLILNSGHMPTEGRIVFVIVCIYVNVFSGNVSSCNIVYHLLSVSTCCKVSLLGNTGSKLNGRRREVGEVGVLVVFNVVTRKMTYIVCECVANCTSESDKILSTAKISCTLKGCNKLVGKILCVNSVSNLCTSTVSTKSISHEVCCTILISEFIVHIVHEDLGETVNVVVSVKLAFLITLNAVLNRLKCVHDVICIKVTVIVFLAEAGIVRLVYCVTEVLFTNNSDHLIERTAKLAGLHLKSRNLKKVYKVACPTGNVCVVRAVLVVIGNIHRAKYVTDICLITIRKLKVLKILKTGYSNVDTIGNLCVCCILLILNELCEISILMTCHNTPRAGIVSINTGTDVLNNKSCGILGGIILLNVNVSNLLKKHKVEDEIVVVINLGLAKCGINFLISAFTTLITSLVCAMAILLTGSGLFREINPFVAKSLNKNSSTNSTCLILSTCCLCACGMTGCGNSLLCYENLTATIAVLTLGKTVYGTSGISATINNLVMSKGVNNLLCYENLVTYGAVLTLGKTGIKTICRYSTVNSLGVTGCRNGLLCYDNLATTSAVLTLGNACDSTCRSNSSVSNFLMTKCLSKLSFTNITVTCLRACCAFRKAMTLCCNDLLCHENHSTGRALLTLGKAGFSTSSLNGGNGFL